MLMPLSRDAGGFACRVRSAPIVLWLALDAHPSPTLIYYGSDGVSVNLSFEWDEEKARENYRKHRVSLKEGVTVFRDPLSITIKDPDHSADEQRCIDIGTSEKGLCLVVSYTERGSSIRIISCRKATRSERRRYEEGTE